MLEEGYPPQLNFQVDRSSLPAIIRFYGGDVEQQTPRGIPERVTHVLCRSVSRKFSHRLTKFHFSSIYPQSNNKALIHQALADRRKRMVTYQWLNETLMKKRMEAPSKVNFLGF